MGLAVGVENGNASGNGMLWKDATYSKLKKDHLPYLRDNLSCKIASESTILVLLVVCGLNKIVQFAFR